MKTYFENNFIKISYDTRTRLGVARWSGRLQGPELREAFLLCLEVMDRYSLTRWLADDRLMEAVSEADLDWCMAFYVPRVAATSLLRMAWLPSHSEANRQAIKAMVDKGHTYPLKLVFKEFDNEQEAMAWLLSPL